MFRTFFRAADHGAVLARTRHFAGVAGIVVLGLMAWPWQGAWAQGLTVIHDSGIVDFEPASPSICFSGDDAKA